MDPNPSTPPPQQPIPGQPANPPLADVTPIFTPASPTPAPAPAPQPQPVLPPAAPQPPQPVTPAVAPLGIVNPAGGIVSGDGGLPNVDQGQVFRPVDPTASRPRKRWPKVLLVIAVLIFVLGGSASAFYFGYYANSSVVLSQALSNTGKGYTKLIDYTDKVNQAHYKGSTANGNYSFHSSGYSTDGTTSYSNDGQNSDLKFNIGLATTRPDFEIRTIKSPSSTIPDLYIKADGIDGLGALTGDDQIDKAINQVSGKWIVVDHTFVQNLGGLSQSLSTGLVPQDTKLPNRAQVMSEVRSFGTVNQQYVFTTNKARAVTTVVHNYGVETVGGHKTYHYKLAFNKAHVKAYITAQYDALKGNQLGGWLRQNGHEQDLTSAYNDLEQSADSIKSSDTFELWADLKTRMVYKIRTITDESNPAANYVDFGLNYQGGTQYPFFIQGMDKTGNGSSATTDNYIMSATLNTKDNSIRFNVTGSGTGNSTGTSKYSLSANLTYQPSNSVPAITAPTASETLSQLLDQLGLSDLINSYVQQAANSAATAPPSSGNANNTLLQ